jgi:hypothetical protein
LIRSIRLGGLLMALLVAGTLAGCATAPPSKNYSAFRAENPRSILVVPVLNNTLNVPAPDFFLSTISRPLSERGYYVFPAHMVQRIMQDDGLGDAGLIHQTDSSRLGRLFGCDAVLYVTIQQWDSKYIVISTQTTVKLDYAIKSCKNGALLWEDTEQMVYSPQANSNGGSPLGALIAAAVSAAIEKAAPNYIPLAMQANLQATTLPGRGLPAGPYLTSQYQKDQTVFQSK